MQTQKYPETQILEKHFVFPIFNSLFGIGPKLLWIICHFLFSFQEFKDENYLACSPLSSSSVQIFWKPTYRALSALKHSRSKIC